MVIAVHQLNVLAVKLVKVISVLAVQVLLLVHHPAQAVEQFVAMVKSSAIMPAYSVIVARPLNAWLAVKHAKAISVFVLKVKSSATTPA